MKEILNRYLQEMEPELRRLIPHDECDESVIYDAMSYSLEAGGKRLRPVIMLMFAKLLGLDAADVMPYACALEAVHTYSLIHDDLPAMDNDDMRRGKPTSHKVYGEAIAILAGDALLNLAAELASAGESGISAQRRLAAVSELFSASGTKGMIGGQVIDIISEGKAISNDTLTRLHRLKTGALIKAAGRIAAALAGASQQEFDAITAYCENLGIAFQIRDDLLDVYGSSAELGKNAGSDAANGKTTYVTVYGVEKSELMVEEYTKEAIKSLEMFGDGARELTALAEYLTDRSN